MTLKALNDGYMDILKPPYPYKYKGAGPLSVLPFFKVINIGIVVSSLLL